MIYCYCNDHFKHAAKSFDNDHESEKKAKNVFFSFDNNQFILLQKFTWLNKFISVHSLKRSIYVKLWVLISRLVISLFVNRLVISLFVNRLVIILFVNRLVTILLVITSPWVSRQIMFPSVRKRDFLQDNKTDWNQKKSKRKKTQQNEDIWL